MARMTTKLQVFSQQYNWMRGQFHYKFWERAMVQGRINLPKKMMKQRDKLNKEYNKFAKMIEGSYYEVKKFNFGEKSE